MRNTSYFIENFITTDLFRMATATLATLMHQVKKNAHLTLSQVFMSEPTDELDLERSCFFLGDNAAPLRGDTVSILFIFHDSISV